MQYISTMEASLLAFFILYWCFNDLFKVKSILVVFKSCGAQGCELISHPPGNPFGNPQQNLGAQPAQETALH